MSEERIKCAHLEPNTVYLMVDGEMFKLADMREATALLRECLPWLWEHVGVRSFRQGEEEEYRNLISRIEKAVG